MENIKAKRMRFSLEAACFVFLVFVFLFFRGSVNPVWGSSADNIRGFAWSSNFGWISMNCYNPPTLNTCATVDYGVGIIPSGTYAFNFQGEAWSSGAGWISFQEDGSSIPGFYNFNFHCKNSCTSPNCTACYNPDTGKIYGWAKILSLGNDGWIKLSSTTQTSLLGAYVDQDSPSSSFRGWGWNGNHSSSSGAGWISFNCADLGAGACAASNYFVYLADSHRPEARSLSAPNYNFPLACAQGARQAYLNWDFYDQDPGSGESAYQVIVNDENNTTTPVLLDTGKVLVVGNVEQRLVTEAILSGYDTPYYWWVKVWDNFGLASPWTQFNATLPLPGHTLTDNVARNASVGNSRTFTTYRREFPDVLFDWIPPDPVADYPVTSTDRSFYFKDSDRSVPYACTPATCQYLWSSSNALSISTPTLSSTEMIFGYGRNKEIELRITDNSADNYFCTSSVNFFVDKLPIWIEKKAQ